MSFSYSGNPADSPLDGVRFLVQDTNPNDPQLQDAEINFLVSLYTNIWKSAAYAARNIANKYARQVDKSVGDLRLSYSQRQAAYESMFKDFLRQAANRTSFPYGSGISKSDEMIEVLDPDTKKPAFTKKQFHYPEGANAQEGQDIGPFDENS